MVNLKQPGGVQCVARLNMIDEVVLQPECYKRHALIEDHIQGSKGWRSAIVGIVFAIVIQVITFGYFYGRLTQMVEINTARLTYLEEVHPRVGVVK